MTILLYNTQNGREIMISTKEVGKRIKKIREASGLNQIQVAKFIGVDQSYISKIENGERQLRLDLLEKLANLFGYSMTNLMTDNSFDTHLQIAFRSDEIEIDDLNSISEINKIALNLQEMRKLVKENDYER